MTKKNKSPRRRKTNIRYSNWNVNRATFKRIQKKAKSMGISMVQFAEIVADKLA